MGSNRRTSTSPPHVKQDDVVVVHRYEDGPSVCRFKPGGGAHNNPSSVSSPPPLFTGERERPQQAIIATHALELPKYVGVGTGARRGGGVAAPFPSSTTRYPRRLCPSLWRSLLI